LVRARFRLLWGAGLAHNPPFTYHESAPAALSRGPEAPARTANDHVDYEQFFVSQLPVIDHVVTHVCRRHGLCDTEAEEFASEVKTYILQRDYEVLRRFQHRSSLATYLTVVVQRCYLNFRNRTWGRWRPSADAMRLGPVAVLLERLTGRDGWAFEEAQEQMRTNHGVAVSRDALYALWVRLAPAAAKRFVAEDAARDMVASSAADTHVLQAERAFVDRRVHAALARARQTLNAEERLLIKMRFDDGFTVAQIANALQVTQKPLYRRFDQILAQLQELMTADGISADDVSLLFDENPVPVAPQGEAIHG
jgi:RNA polymerase sigma factor for flagellar operon FliA